MLIMNTEALARYLAYEACMDAEMEGYGFDINNPKDIENFMPRARDRAVRYANILSGAK